MEPGAFEFDSIATQAGQSSRKEGGSRILFKEAHESDQCCVAAPSNTTRYTTRNTTELLAGAAFLEP